MKIRKGFVSNSSSSSFLLVGVETYNDERAARQAVADSWEEGWGGYHTGKSGLVYLGSEYDYDSDDRNFNPYHVGIEAEEVLNSGGTVEQLRTAFIEKSAALGITWRPGEVRLVYGECQSE